jgi:hypothetical protein
LLAVGYAMGGITLDYMLMRIILLLASCLVVASVSLACSAWCGSTVSAFFMTYSVGLILFVGLAICVLPHFAIDDFSELEWTQTQIAVAAQLIASAVFIALASNCLVRRAFVTPRNFVLAAFHALDAIYVNLNRDFGNIVLTREAKTLPDMKPIAWRETDKKSLSTVRYLVRVFVAIEFPTIFVLVSMAQGGNFAPSNATTGHLWSTVWCITAALIAVMCGSLVSGERTRQTLPILLSTPIPGDEIVKQLLAGVRRLIRVLWIPLGTIAAFECWFNLNMRVNNQATAEEQLICNLLQMAIYPSLIAWGTFFVGTKIKSPIWAIVTSLSIVAAVVLVPYLCIWVLELAGAGFPGSRYLLLTSPATIILTNEGREAMLTLTAVNFLLYGCLTLCIRRACLNRADRLLGRAEMNRLFQVPATVSEEVLTA